MVVGTIDILKNTKIRGFLMKTTNKVCALLLGALFVGGLQADYNGQSVTQREYSKQGSRRVEHEHGVRRGQAQGQYPRKQKSSGMSNGQSAQPMSRRATCAHDDKVQVNNGLNNGRQVMYSFDGQDIMTVGALSNARMCYSNPAPQQGQPKNPLWIGINDASGQPILPMTMVSRPNNTKPKSVVVKEKIAPEEQIYVLVHYAGRTTDSWRVEHVNGVATLVRVEDRREVKSVSNSK